MVVLVALFSITLKIILALMHAVYPHPQVGKILLFCFTLALTLEVNHR
jgi:hypothetical protein